MIKINKEISKLLRQMRCWELGTVEQDCGIHSVEALQNFQVQTHG
jgi:hypothetical protein